VEVAKTMAAAIAVVDAGAATNLCLYTLFSCDFVGDGPRRAHRTIL
jgi:hypothetical protein